MKNVWERRSHAFPPHYTSAYTLYRWVPLSSTCPSSLSGWLHSRWTIATLLLNRPFPFLQQR